MSEVSELRGLIEGLRRDSSTIDPYLGRRSYAERAHEVAQRLDSLVSDGPESGATPLLRGVIDLLTTAQTRMVDGSEAFGGLLDYAIKTYVRALRADDLVGPQSYRPRVEELRNARGPLSTRLAEFERRPDTAGYGGLRSAVTELGAASDWPPVRAWALSLLQSRLPSRPELAHGLIGMLLDEGDMDAAWAVAMKYDIGGHDLLDLVALREATHPADVIEPYQWLIELRINMVHDKDHYDNAIKLIQRLGVAYDRVNDRRGFVLYLEDLCSRYQRRGAFLAKLDAVRPAG